MLGAGVGIAAWVAVVGGARVWARLEAIDVPASSTVAVLPRELLIGEGVRTLLVPLLLGGVIAIFTYLSRRADADDERRSFLGLPRADTRDAALREARQAEASAKSAAERLGVALGWAVDIEDAKRRELDRQIKELRARLFDAQQWLVTAADHLGRVAVHTYDLSGPAEAAPDAQRFRDIGNQAGAEARKLEMVRVDLTRVVSAVARKPGDDAVRTRIAKARTATENSSSQVRKLRDELKPKPLVWLTEAFERLGPIEYLRGWIGRFADGPGSQAAVVIVVLLLVAFTAIALAVIGAALGWMAIAGAASILVLVVIAGRQLDKRLVAVTGTVLLVGLAALAYGLIGQRAWMLGLAVAPIVLVPALAQMNSRDDRWQIAAWAVLLLALPIVALAGFLGAIGWWTIGAVLLTVLTVWLAMGALRRSSTAPATAWILFVAIAFWSGALAFVAELGAITTTLGTAVVVQKDRADSVTGLFLGRTATAVYLASTNTVADECKVGENDRNDADDQCSRTVISVPQERVACVSYGPPAEVNNSKRFVRAPPEEKSGDVDDNIKTSVDAGYNTDEVCESADSGTTDDDRLPPESGDTTVTTNEWNLLNGLRIGFARPSPPEATPPPEVRVFGPFRIVLGGGSGPSEPREPRGRVVVGTVLFRFDKADVTAHGHANVEVAAREIRNAGAERVFLAGHADEKGSHDANVWLSDERTAAVKEALESHLPRSVTIRTHGFGEVMPLACNRRPGGADNSAGRQLNRRVEIRTRPLMTWEDPRC